MKPIKMKPVDMVKPIIFFPFTRMTPEQIQTMDLFFNGFTLLTINQHSFLDPGVAAALKTNRITRVCVEDDIASLVEAKVKSFKDWAAVHRGNEKNLKALIRENTYFQDETDVTAIQSGIRRGSSCASEQERDVGADPFLFLRFAEILDRENETIQGELDKLELNNCALLAQLRGEEFSENEIFESIQRPDSGTDRTLNRIQERIQAWCKAAGKIGLFDGGGECPVLATTSQAVFDYFTANFDPEINGLDNDYIKVHEHDCDRRQTRQQEFYHALEEIISGKKPSWTMRSDGQECGCRTGGFRLCRFSGGVVNEKFNIPGTQVVVCLVKLNS